MNFRSPVVLLVAVAVSFLGFSCENGKKEVALTPVLDYSVRSTMPHDVAAFTQGLVIHQGQLYESTGQEGSSWIGIVDINTGIAERKAELSPSYFGEGITILNNKVYQLTWKNKTGFIYDLKTFKQTGTFSYSGEGWGITHDGKNLIMSDGTSSLAFFDTVTLRTVRTLEVYDSRGSVPLLNELEYAEGFIYANVWQTNKIARIDPTDGKVVGYIDLTLLRDQAVGRNPQADVLNGIAWHKATGSFLVTGKYWPGIYVIQIRENAVQ
ncbi:MAG: glutaminyl-peptide cyclotransferase [Cyclobacteriaceae bacterium]